MLLDRYLVPVVELGFSVALPFVLTLKTVHLTQQCTDPSPTPQFAHQLLSFWMLYWFLVFLVEFCGASRHIRCLVAALYFTQHNSMRQYMAKFYELTLLSHSSSIISKVANVKVRESELDNFLEYVLEKLCLDSGYLTRSLMEFTVPQTVTYRGGSKFAPFRTMEIHDEDEEQETIVPLEIAKVRNKEETRRTRRRSTSGASQVGLEPKRSRSRSTVRPITSVTMMAITPEHHAQPSSQSSSRSSSGDLVFVDEPGRKGIRDSIKGLFSP